MAPKAVKKSGAKEAGCCPDKATGFEADQVAFKAAFPPESFHPDLAEGVESLRECFGSCFAHGDHQLRAGNPDLLAG